MNKSDNGQSILPRERQEACNHKENNIWSEAGITNGWDVLVPLAVINAHRHTWICLCSDIHAHYPIIMEYRQIHDTLEWQFSWKLSTSTVWRSMKRMSVHVYTRKRKLYSYGSMEHTRYAKILNRDFRSDKPFQNMYKSKNVYTTKEITSYIQRDMITLNKSVRVVDSPLEKKTNEYIVAMKTSDIILPNIGAADYHFAVQLGDGTWADKPGQTPSRWNVIDGTAIAWDCCNIKNYYNTESIYFAAEK